MRTRLFERQWRDSGKKLPRVLRHPGMSRIRITRFNDGTPVFAFGPVHLKPSIARRRIGKGHRIA